MRQEEFWKKCALVFMPVIKMNLSYYTRDIPTNLKEYYQAGKIFEEVGELIQATHMANYCPSMYKKYEDIRGTVESEAADVVIASLGYLCITKSKMLYSSVDNTMDGDTVLFTTQLVLHASNYHIRKLILSIFNYFEVMNLDLYKSVKERIEFNTEEIKKQKRKETEGKKEGKENAGKE